MWEIFLWKINSYMWYCLSLCLVDGHYKTKAYRKLFPLKFARLNGICGMMTCSPICWSTAISVKIAWFPKSRHTILVPQRPFDGFKFLRSIMGQSFFKISLCGGSPFDNKKLRNYCWSFDEDWRKLVICIAMRKESEIYRC